MPKTKSQDIIWHKVAELDELPEGRVKTVVAGTKSLALTHLQGQYAAMDNRCPTSTDPLEKAPSRKAWGGNAGCGAHGMAGISIL